MVLGDVLWTRINSHLVGAPTDGATATPSLSQSSLQPFLDLLVRTRDETSTWQLLATLSAMVVQPAMRDLLLAGGLIDILISRLQSLVEESESLKVDGLDINADEFKQRIHQQRVLARQRAVIICTMNNCVSGLTESHFPMILTTVAVIDLATRLLRRQWEEKERLRQSKSSHDNVSVFTELQALLALLSNMTFSSLVVATYLSATQAHSDLFKDMLESSSCAAGAAAILANVAGKSPELCRGVGSATVVRRCLRTLKRANQLELILNIVSLLKAILFENKPLAIYAVDENGLRILNAVPFFPASDGLVDELRKILKQSSKTHRKKQSDGSDPQRRLVRKSSQSSSKSQNDAEPSLDNVK